MKIWKLLLPTQRLAHGKCSKMQSSFPFHGCINTNVVSSPVKSALQMFLRTKTPISPIRGEETRYTHLPYLPQDALQEIGCYVIQQVTGARHRGAVSPHWTWATSTLSKCLGPGFFRLTAHTAGQASQAVEHLWHPSHVEGPLPAPVDSSTLCFLFLCVPAGTWAYSERHINSPRWVRYSEIGYVDRHAYFWF